MSNFEKEVIRIILNNPTNFNRLLKLKFPKSMKHVHSICNYWFSNRYGLEFETGQEFSNDAFVKYSGIVRKYGYEVFLVNCYEQKYSGKGLLSLIGLYNILEMIKTNPINTKSGIHCHINFTGNATFFDPSYCSTLFVKFLCSNFVFDYTGYYNEHCASYNKEAIRYHLTYNTIEYRMLPMEVNFKQLVKFIMICQYSSKHLAVGKIPNAKVILDLMQL